MSKEAASTKPVDKRRFWLGAVGPKDDFGAPIGKVFIDGATRRGPWAIMSVASWKMHGVGRLGLGAGQKYERQKDGRWLKIEG